MGSPSNGRREYSPALPPLQGASSHGFIAYISNPNGRMFSPASVPYLYFFGYAGVAGNLNGFFLMFSRITWMAFSS